MLWFLAKIQIDHQKKYKKLFIFLRIRMLNINPQKSNALTLKLIRLVPNILGRLTYFRGKLLSNFIFLVPFIFQAPEIAGVILSKPNWMWGAEMGANTYGVCIGNEAVWSGSVDAETTKRLLGMDLVRLGLERGKSARDALDVITSLLEIYGQGGPCSYTMEDLTYHNSYLIADSKEAWVLETVGKYWAAEHVEVGFRNISNCLSIGTKIDLMNPSLKEEAKKLGFWDPLQEFNFSKVFGDGDVCDR